MNSNVSDISRTNAPNMQDVSRTEVPADPLVSNEPQQVTQWIDDAAVQRTSLPEPIVPKQDVLASASETREHNIHDVLERPVQIDNLLWQDTQGFDEDIATYNFPEELLAKAPNLVDKITHFTFLRAHVVVRFVVNANPFQAGRLVAFFAPYSQESDIGSRTTINNFMSSKTTFPRVVLDAGAGNSGELTIPFASYYTHYDLARGLGDLGSIRVSVLNPLQSGNAYVSIFARLTNISLEVPTAVSNELGTFSSVFNELRLLTQSEPCATRKCLADDVLKILRRPRAQVADCSQEEANMAKSGMMASTLDKISTYATMLDVIPGLGAVVKPVAWAAKAASQVASVFGLSKPQNLLSTNKLVSIPGYGFTTLDGNDNSAILGSSIENEVVTRNDLFGSAVDEMDISFVAKHECYLDQRPWTQADAPGTIIATINVTPGAVVREIINSTPVFNSTALAYVSSMFRLWRGSLKVKVQVTKTAYHSGRLRVSFVPGGTFGDLAKYDFNQGYSEIVDLRTTDEIDFVIPYVSNTIWKPVEIMEYSGTADLENATTGIVVVEILNSLRRPDNVTDTVSVNLWMSGGDDFQLAIPDFINYIPVKEPSPARARAQVLGQFQDAGFNQAMSNTGDMFVAPKMSAIDANSLTIGEHVQNLRAVSRRFGVVIDTNIPVDNHLTLNTSYFNEPLEIGSTQTNLPVPPIDYISFLYRFFRGSQRYKIQIAPSNISSGVNVFSDPALPRNAVAPIVQPTAGTRAENVIARGSGYSHYINTVYNTFIEYLTPYFSNTHISLIRGSDADIPINGDYSTSSYITIDGGGDAKVFKAAGDDFSFGWLVGPPRLQERPPLSFIAGLDFSSATSVLQDSTSPIQYSILNVAVTTSLSAGFYKFVIIGTSDLDVTTVYSIANGSMRIRTGVVVINELIPGIKEATIQTISELLTPSGTFDAASTLLNVNLLGLTQVTLTPI